MKTRLWPARVTVAFALALCTTGQILAQTNPQPGQSAIQLQPAPSHKTNIAVINLKSSSGVEAGEADLISDRLRGELFNTGKVNVMERDQMQEILKEQGFQQSGACTNEECMVQMGQMLGVEQLITGSLGKVGSMFLVNLRIIDVKTAKIIKVVSKDIKGSIEDVVGELNPIAGELVGISDVTGTVEKKEPGVSEQPKPATISEPSAKEDKKEDVLTPMPNDRAEKNKNRFGIGLGTRLYFGYAERIAHRTLTDSLFNVTTNDLNYDSVVYNLGGVQYKPTVTNSVLANYYFHGIIKAGPFIAIDIGGGYSKSQTEYEWDDPVNYKETHVTEVFSIPSVGVNFVKRWYPIKMNVGPFFDLNFLDYSVTFASRAYDYLPFLTDTTLSFFSMNLDFGIRAGVEIMAGKHVGINFDLVYCYSEFTTLSQTRNLYNSYGETISSDEMTFDLRMPEIGLGLGVNFYF